MSEPGAHEEDEAKSADDVVVAPEWVEDGIREMVKKLPRPVRVRAENALQHFDRALSLLEIDREMASFRAITGEEEAAAALFKALQLQGYPQADQLWVKDHTHKAAALACALAIRSTIGGSVVKKIQVTFDLRAPRIDVWIPFSEFNIDTPATRGVGLQIVEPLDLLRANPNGSDKNVYEDDLRRLAEGSKFTEIKQLVKSQANARNTLLYATNKSLPKSRATRTHLLERKGNGLLLLAIAIIALQASKHQALLRQAIEALLEVVKRLPREASTA